MLGGRPGPDGQRRRLDRCLRAFEREARDVQPGYQPRTVGVDGWAATRQAWLAPFPLAVLLRRFLHGWLNIRRRGKLDETFAGLSAKVWEAYRAAHRRAFAQRPRRLWQWAGRHVKGAWVPEPVKKLCGRSKGYAVADEHPGGHRTRTRPDRVMRGMSRSFEGCQHRHGSREACGRHVRAWALSQNFRPWGPQAVRDNEGWRSPAERLNGHRYHDDWLRTLLVSASLGGFRR